MKYFWVVLIFPILAFANDCSIDGITDSPQKMTCYLHAKGMIKMMDVECREGNYQIDWDKKIYEVDQAYHEEVERGANPLVFQAGGLSLTTTSYQIYSIADLRIDGHRYDGMCFNK